MAVRALLRRMTPLDRLIVAILLLGTLVSFFWLGTTEQGERVVVQRQGKIVFSAPLGQDREVSLPGPLGETVLAIRGGRAHIVSSPCPHKVCMGMGEAQQAGEFLACVPNEVLVRIEGAPPENRSYDLISQ